MIWAVVVVIENVLEAVSLYADKDQALARMRQEFLSYTRAFTGISQEAAEGLAADELTMSETADVIASILHDKVDVYVYGVRVQQPGKDNSAKNKLPFRRR